MSTSTSAVEPRPTFSVELSSKSSSSSYISGSRSTTGPNRSESSFLSSGGGGGGGTPHSSVSASNVHLSLLETDPLQTKRTSLAPSDTGTPTTSLTRIRRSFTSLRRSFSSVDERGPSIPFPELLKSVHQDTTWNMVAFDTFLEQVNPVRCLQTETPAKSKFHAITSLFRDDVAYHYSSPSTGDSSGAPPGSPGGGAPPSPAPSKKETYASIMQASMSSSGALPSVPLPIDGVLAKAGLASLRNVSGSSMDVNHSAAMTPAVSGFVYGTGTSAGAENAGSGSPKAGPGSPSPGASSPRPGTGTGGARSPTPSSPSTATRAVAAAAVSRTNSTLQATSPVPPTLRLLVHANNTSGSCIRCSECGMIMTGTPMLQFIQLAITAHEANALEQSLHFLRHAQEADAAHPFPVFLESMYLRHGWGCKPDHAMAYQTLHRALMLAVDAFKAHLRALGNGGGGTGTEGLAAPGTAPVVVPETLTRQQPAKPPAEASKYRGASATPLPVPPFQTSSLRSGVALVLYELSSSHRFAWGVRKNRDLAHQLMEVAANMGDRDACVDVGMRAIKDGNKRLAAQYLRWASFAGADPATDRTPAVVLTPPDPDDCKYPLPFHAYDPHGEDARASYPALTLVEQELAAYLCTVRDKLDWAAKWRCDPATRAAWLRELQEVGGATPTQVAYIAQELDFQASEDPWAAGPDNVFALDGEVPDVVHYRLLAAVRRLEVASAARPDWHPGTRGTVRNLVHPSNYPLVYGATRVRYAAADRARSVAESVRYYGNAAEEEARAPPPPPRERANRIGTPPDFQSQRYQWLPSEVRVSADGEEVSVRSYINGLHPERHADVYEVVEGVVKVMRPLFEATLARLASPVRPRIEWNRWQMYPQRNWGDPAVPIQAEAPPVQPDIPARVRLQSSAKRSAELMPVLTGRNMQVIVKLATLCLTPETPRSAGGSWHVEGMLNERIVATGLYYYESDNVTPASLSFQSAVRAPPLVPDDHRGAAAVFGLRPREPAAVHRGTVTTHAGRVVCFPNTYVHQLGPVELVDATRPGFRKVLAVFLVDPQHPVVSTAMVSPQPAGWLADTVVAGMAADDDKEPVVPAEVVRMIADRVPGRMTETEARAHRDALMAERTRSVPVGRRVSAVLPSFNLCEH
ncbi:hypothetical protein H9P43_005197 [Blastocladiella emersonii ATCC 22665]|nr:hypothetical protein H9P43_005197 [Blastocladiella emersonii ATCC 22665]